MQINVETSIEPSAPLVEVFSSIQGEGIHVGRRQVFVRTFGCNLSCEYCDTPTARTAAPLVWSALSPEGEIFSNPNPANVSDVIAAVHELESVSGPHHSLLITGGEPLLHPAFVAELSRRSREMGLPVHLETNGTLPEALAAILGYVDVIAADVKLKSASGEDIPPALHAEFLSLAITAGKEVFVKMIVTSATDLSEIQNAAEMVAKINPEIPLVIQPAASPPGRQRIIPSGTKLLEMQRACLHFLRDVRVIPQCHKILGVR